MKYLCMYDIANKKRLTKVANILSKNGLRTQYSFFECDLSKNEMINLYNKLKKIIDCSEDKLFVVPINSFDEQNIIRIGKIPNSISMVF